MARKPNTNRNGGTWTESQKRDTWKKGNIILGRPSSEWRKDKCGKVMKWSEHGNRNSNYGWEIDHKRPVVHGGTDVSDNLQPLHWKNNMSKGDKLNWKC